MPGYCKGWDLWAAACVGESMTSDGADVLVEMCEGQRRRDEWGYTYIRWTLLRVRLSRTRVRFEPTLFTNWILFSLPTWEATWDDLTAVTAIGSHVRFTRKDGPELTYFAMGGTARVMACVP